MEPAIDVHDLDGLKAAATAFDVDLDVPVFLSVHGVGSLAEAVEMYGDALVLVRERRWSCAELPDLARVAGLAAEVDRVVTELLPRVLANPPSKAPLLLLLNAGWVIRHLARELSTDLVFPINSITNRLLRLVRRVIKGRADPDLLAERLPAIGVDFHQLTQAPYIALI